MCPLWFCFCCVVKQKKRHEKGARQVIFDKPNPLAKHAKFSTICININNTF